jgi:hypothetical protein
VAGADERVKLWVDDQWIIDQWNSLSSTEPSGTLFVAANVNPGHETRDTKRSQHKTRNTS